MAGNKEIRETILADSLDNKPNMEIMMGKLVIEDKYVEGIGTKYKLLFQENNIT